MNPSPKRQGNQFEILFERTAHRQDIAILRIADGCIRLGVKKLIPTKQPADFILSSEGKTAVIDTKTQATGGTFSFEKLNPHQINSMLQLSNKGTIAGYIIWTRSINRIVFANVKDLFFCLSLQQSFKIQDGIDLGTIEELNLKPLFATKTGYSCDYKALG